ncbi:MAG: ABC transporter permease [Verrucomicrobia bacterium]|nr:ABC transporter permease [Verrucomicrobiota bacterium]
MNDLKFAFRQLLKNPGFTTVAVLTLALGVGGSTAVFSLIHTVILQPLPFPDPERLVLVWTTLADGRTTRSAYGSYADWKEQCAAFEDLAIYDGFTCLLTGTEASEKISATRTSANFFSILRASPVLGRTFTEEDGNQRARLVVVSHGLWQRRFAGDPNVVGRTIGIDGQTAVIAGVLPEHFDFFGDSELWQLQPPEQPAPRGAGPWFVLGRLKEGKNLGQAQAELQSVAARLAQAYPGTNRDLSARMVPLAEAITGPNLRLALWILFGAVACVLLIGCSNLANLLLVRGVARRRELATRLALGASPLRVARQLIVECLPIGLIGGLAGVALARVLIQVVRALAGTRIPRLAEAGLDPVVLGFALALTVLATLLFAIIPGLQARRLDVNESLKEGARGTGGLREKSLRHALLVGQVALAFTLLFGAGLLLRSFQSVRAMDLGFDAERLFCVGIRFPQTKSRDEAVMFYGELTRRLEALPGVEGVGLIEDAFGGGNAAGRITIEEGATPASQVELGLVRSDSITPSWFQAVGAPLLRGRAFDESDRAGALPVVIINETMARRLWPGQDPVGKRFKFGLPESRQPWLTIIGLARDMRRERLERAPIAQVFLPVAQRPSLHMELHVKTRVPPLALAESVRRESYAIDKSVAVYGGGTMEKRIGASLFERKFQASLLAAFSGVALLLAAIGTYGIVHFSVQQRTREIGVRMALGAQQLDVLSIVMSEGLKLILIGVGLGVALALSIARLMQRLLFEVNPTDPLTFAAVALLLGGIALFACWLPARRAAKIHPMEALRNE